VLRRYFAAQKYSQEQQAWWLVLYVAFYNLASAEAAFAQMPTPPLAGKTLDLRLATGTERRGFRGNGNAKIHLDSLLFHAAEVGGVYRWLSGAIEASSPEENWQRVRARYEAVAHSGPWSSYKMADLLKNVCGLPLSGWDIGVGGGSKTAGPVAGMQRLTGWSLQECLKRDNQLKLYELLKGQGGMAFSGIDQMETCLCDFNSLCKGNYYVGHDIDMQQEHFASVGPGLWEARQASFAHELLGEHGGWVGVRKGLKTLYRDNGFVYRPGRALPAGAKAVRP
jgi:hypothetical protein